MWKWLLIILSALTVVGNAALFSGASAVGPFQGNPNVTINSITASIAASRTTCQTPCFVQVSASPTTASGTSVPYEDLEYQWNFGNASGTEIFNQPLDLNGKRYNPQPVNANNSQWGPEAAYVFRSAGTYTVTLSARGKNGTSFTIGSATQTITVTAFSAAVGYTEWYFDSAAAGGGSGTIGSPFNDLATLNTKASISNTQIYIKRGSSWSSATGILIAGTTSGIRIDAYSTGANPIIDINSGTGYALTFNNGGSSTPLPKSDFVFSQLTLTNSGTVTATNVVLVNGASNATAALSNIYFDNCALSTTVNVASSTVINMSDDAGSGNHTGSNYGLWNVTVSQPLTPNLGNRIGFFGGPKDWFFTVGGSFIGAGTNNVLDHHMYPDIKTHVLFRYINFGSGPSKDFNINLNWDGAGSLEYAEFILMSDNNFSGTLRAFDAGNALNDPSLTQYRNYVAQRNSFQALTGDAVLLLPLINSFTLRDSLIFNVDGGRFYSPAASAAAILSDRLYRNLAYRTGGQANGAFYSWIGVSAFTGGTRTFTDNVTYDTEVTAKAIALVWADVQGGSIINRNQWYVPNDGDAAYLYDNATAKTFAQWQAAGFDTAGSVANPAWVDPANGNFNQ